jgi:hypothetical protein
LISWPKIRPAFISLNLQQQDKNLEHLGKQKLERKFTVQI